MQTNLDYDADRKSVFKSIKKYLFKRGIKIKKIESLDPFLSDLLEFSEFKEISLTELVNEDRVEMEMVNRWTASLEAGYAAADEVIDCKDLEVTDVDYAEDYIDLTELESLIRSVPSSASAFNLQTIPTFPRSRKSIQKEILRQDIGISTLQKNKMLRDLFSPEEEQKSLVLPLIEEPLILEHETALDNSLDATGQFLFDMMTEATPLQGVPPTRRAQAVLLKELATKDEVDLAQIAKFFEPLDEAVHMESIDLESVGLIEIDSPIVPITFFSLNALPSVQIIDPFRGSYRKVKKEILGVEIDLASTRRIPNLGLEDLSSKTPSLAFPPLTSFYSKPLPRLKSSLLSEDFVGALRSVSLELAPAPKEEVCIVPERIIQELETFGQEFPESHIESMSSDDESEAGEETVYNVGFKTAITEERTVSTEQVTKTSARQPFSASAGIANFLRLRGIANVIEQQQAPEMSVVEEEVTDLEVLGTSTTADFSQALVELCQAFQTEEKPLHRYFASSLIIQNTELMALLENDFQIELIEREMGSKSLILDSNSVLVLVPLSRLPIVSLDMSSSSQKLSFLEQSELGQQLLRLAAHFSKINILIEGVTNANSALYSFTSPILRSLASLDLFASLVLGHLECKLSVLFSSSVLETACLIRMCGDEIVTNDRPWLDAESATPSAAELFLTSIPGLNHFSSKLIMTQCGSLANLARMSLEDLLIEFGFWIDEPRLRLFHFFFHS